MSVDPGRTLVDELARALPRMLDDAALEELAARLHPHLASLVATASNGEKLLTTAEAADRAHVHVETVRRAIRAGNLAVAARIGQSPRVTTLAVDRWLADTSQTGRASRKVRSRRSRHSTQPHEYSLAAALKTTT
jgi:excisionase family DNA binding protein